MSWRKQRGAVLSRLGSGGVNVHLVSRVASDLDGRWLLIHSNVAVGLLSRSQPFKEIFTGFFYRTLLLVSVFFFFWLDTNGFILLISLLAEHDSPSFQVGSFREINRANVHAIVVHDQGLSSAEAEESFWPWLGAHAGTWPSARQQD